MAGSPGGGGKEQAKLCSRHIVPAGEPGTATHPAGTGAWPGSHRPSASNPNSEVPGEDSGSAATPFEDEFWTPISESSEAS